MLIITGSIAYDYIMDFPDAFSNHILPEKIHNINLSFIVDKFAKRRGGTAGNVSYTLGLLHTPHTLFSVAGKDFTEYRKAFTKLGVSVKDVQVKKQEYTATGFCMTDRRDNQIWGYFYGAAQHIPSLKIKKVAEKGDLLLVGPAGTAGSMSMIRQCIQLGVTYMFDPGFILTQVSDEDLTLGVTYADYLIGNDYEMNLIRKRITHPEKVLSGKTIITTKGNQGALIEFQGNVYTIKSAVVSSVVDPTGAGDAWRAGFLAGREKSYDLQTCGQMGSIAAAFAIEQYGTQEHTFTKKIFTQRYKQQFGTEIIV